MQSCRGESFSVKHLSFKCNEKTYLIAIRLSTDCLLTSGVAHSINTTPARTHACAQLKVTKVLKTAECASELKRTQWSGVEDRAGLSFFFYFFFVLQSQFTVIQSSRLRQLLAQEDVSSVYWKNELS